MAWKVYQPNPMKINTGDCVIRAISAATGWNWYETYDELCERGREAADLPNADRVWWSLLYDLGFQKRDVPTACPNCITVRKFAKENPHGIYIVGPKEHAVAIIDGNWYDSWNSGDNVVTYYFRRD